MGWHFNVVNLKRRLTPNKAIELPALRAAAHSHRSAAKVMGGATPYEIASTSTTTRREP